VFAAEGRTQVEAPKGRWLVPPDRPVWVPARLAHPIDALAGVEMRSIYSQPRWLAVPRPSRQLKSEFVVAIGPLLREPVLALLEEQGDRERVMRLAGVVIGELARAGDATTFTPMPSDLKTRQVAELLLNDPADDRDLDALARAVGVSGRTLSRLFLHETGLTFKVWRQRAHPCSNRAVGTAQPIKRVATKLRFSSTAAFSFAFRFAFRQVTGQTSTPFLSRRASR
jgi:AraC-like DNA-binding protein